MKNELQIIDERKVLEKDFRMYGTKENPLFKADDVAKWIEHSNTSKMLKSIDEDEKTQGIISTLTNSYTALFLTEDGLYEVLMQSRKPIAKKFKKEVKKILKTIRKTGGYIANSEMMVETYFGALDNNHKELVKGLFQNIENQQRLIQEKDKEIQRKEDIIIGLVDDITLAEKRQILNRVVRKVPKYQERWRELYKNFEMKYHINLKQRFNRYNNENKPKMKNKLDYIDKVMNKIPELYEIACKLYENDIKELQKELYELNQSE